MAGPYLMIQEQHSGTLTLNGRGSSQDLLPGKNIHFYISKPVSYICLRSNATCSLDNSIKLDCNPGDVGGQQGCVKKGNTNLQVIHELSLNLAYINRMLLPPCP